jgi:predicted site-specific integrase-resolvase
MLKKLVPIREAAEALGVSAQTLRRWEREGRLLPDERTAGGRRRYDLARLKPEMFRAQADAARKTVAYARVSSHDQKDDLERQKQVLEIYCARQGWTFEVITVFSAQLYGSRSSKNQKLIDAVRSIVGGAAS